MTKIAKPFLTAEWRRVAMLNYAVDPSLLARFVPAGTELDFFDGKTYLSLIGFRFIRTRLRGLWVPFHSDFEEVNLRIYVKRRTGGEVRRGVAFVREIVPRYAIAKAAQMIYGERYLALPMAHRIAGPTSEWGRMHLEYRWRLSGAWNTLSMECEGKPAHAAEGGLEQFITEHYWGYAAQRDGGALEYRVEHDRWRIWRATSAKFTGDCSAIYGADLSECLTRPADSAFVADGSAVRVYPGYPISR